jgi:hypothetical protein
MFSLLNYLGNKDEANGMTLHPLLSGDCAVVVQLLGSGQYNTGPISTPNITFSVNLMTASKLYVHNKSATRFNNKDRGRPPPNTHLLQLLTF